MISGEAIVNAWKERRRSHATPPLPQHPQLPADCYSHILKFINVADRPLTNRASLVSYVQKKNRRLGAIPLLVDLSWHGGTCLGRYCVCRAATLQERIEEYARATTDCIDLAARRPWRSGAVFARTCAVAQYARTCAQYTRSTRNCALTQTRRSRLGET